MESGESEDSKTFSTCHYIYHYTLQNSNNHQLLTHGTPLRLITWVCHLVSSYLHWYFIWDGRLILIKNWCKKFQKWLEVRGIDLCISHMLHPHPYHNKQPLPNKLVKYSRASMQKREGDPRRSHLQVAITWDS
jgi:hypothetical protein